LGLPAAARFYVQGFSKRTNLAVTLEVDDDLGRFGAETELALFRVLQESLTNIQKHSGSTTARLRLALDGNRVVLEVQDNGRGFAGPGNGDEMALGVGLSSMRERLEQLGGELVLQSNDGGTSLRAALPVTVA
jgi:signal transduction histidine kinase